MNASKERQGMLFILVGPGGVGKNALLNALLGDFDDLEQLPTATTRAIRTGEQEGREHQFVSLETFQQMIVDDALIEYQEVHPGKFYGVPRATVEKAIDEGRDLIADIEVLGASIIRQEYPDNSVLVFIAPPSIDALLERLNHRDASEKDITDRLHRLPMEMCYAPVCSHIIVNDDIETATAQLKAIVQKVRNQASSEGLYTEMDVGFAVEVKLVHEDQQLVRQDAPLHVEIAPGEMPTATVLRLLKQSAISAPSEAYLVYGVSGDSPKPDSALSIAYQAEKHTYHLTYHFTYLMPEHIDPPVGWHWEKFTPRMSTEVRA